MFVNRIIKLRNIKGINKNLIKLHSSKLNNSDSRTDKLLNSTQESENKWSSTRVKFIEEENKNQIKIKSSIISTKYKQFKDDEATIILDVEEEKLKLQNIALEELEDESLIYDGINIKRGRTGVYEIEDLVEVLRRDNAVDIFVCSVPKEIKYADYVCIVSGKSFRHMLAMAQFVRKIYKLKMHQKDIIPKIEGETSKEWMALDLGNIILHIFSPQTRQQYDLESLWTVGYRYDKECNKPDSGLVNLYEKHSIFLSDLKPKKKLTE